MSLSQTERPYSIKSQGVYDGVYIRVGASSRQIPAYRVREMTLESMNHSFDQQKTERKLTEQEIQTFCQRLYKHALSCALPEDRPKIREVGLNQLISWKLVLNKDDALFATHGYQLLDGQLDDYFGAFIQCAVFKGTDRAYFVTRRDYRGPIDEQIEDANTFVLEHINMGMRLNGVLRQDVYELPVFSIRELIANAVCHRSYMSDARIQVAIFDDRLEITTPGYLDRDQTLDKIRSGQSFIRNKGIAEALSYIGIIEAWGSGMPRVIREAKEYGLKLTMEDRIGDFRINLYRRAFEYDELGVMHPTKSAANDGLNGSEKTCEPVNDGLNGSEKADVGVNDGANGSEKTNGGSEKTNDGSEKLKDVSDAPTTSDIIIQQLQQNPNITIRELASFIGISTRAIEKALSQLSQNSLVVRVGGRKTGYWIVKSI